MPQGQKQQCTRIADRAIVEELQAFVDVARHPQVGINIEGLYVMLHAGASLQQHQLHIRAAIPIDFLAIFAIVRYS